MTTCAAPTEDLVKQTSSINIHATAVILVQVRLPRSSTGSTPLSPVAPGHHAVPTMGTGLTTVISSPARYPALIFCNYIDDDVDDDVMLEPETFSSTTLKRIKQTVVEHGLSNCLQENSITTAPSIFLLDNFSAHTTCLKRVGAGKSELGEGGSIYTNINKRLSNI